MTVTKLKEKFKKTNDRNLQKSYQEKVKENIKKYEELKSKREMSKELLNTCLKYIPVLYYVQVIISKKYKFIHTNFNT